MKFNINIVWQFHVTRIICRYPRKCDRAHPWALQGPAPCSPAAHHHAGAEPACHLGESSCNGELLCCLILLLNMYDWIKLMCSVMGAAFRARVVTCT
jgi:hypothetical protein